MTGRHVSQAGMRHATLEVANLPSSATLPSVQRTFEPVDQQALTARLAGAGSMRADIEHVMSTVPDDASPEEYRRAIRQSSLWALKSGIRGMGRC
jgi:hypothetical protein